MSSQENEETESKAGEREDRACDWGDTEMSAE